ncbi:hypothetical protein [Nitratidesulfovibrio sp. SRB-5]|uniref:hypothetical protein n=1 Tax=Nitratidesulfovibrio sp. SRB-5 TaxID=2872636 RepID=UPI001027A7F4|nr:hypothetical protein [Nitratidesulfovibrio sp. SRB-5]MBZ2171841.1 hypothetical protein [Nitratidesulfovibrio sp. SRB-5]RXF77467.1 hypothetical protein EKK70_06225 [Desulfovibrio sp. DS-1]
MTGNGEQDGRADTAPVAAPVSTFAPVPAPASALPPVIATVILHYGDPALAANLADTLRRADPDHAERVLVLDNAAPRPAMGAWRRLPDNLFWGGALAYCMDAARDMGCTHLWFLNNDISFETRPPLVARAALRMARMGAALAARGLGGPESKVGVYAPAVDRNPYHPQMVRDARLQYRRVALVDGIAPIIDLDCAREVGGADCAANPRGYGVDVWLSLRAHRAGWPVVVDHQLVVRHRYHTTARSVDGFMDAAARAEHDYMTRRLGPAWRDEVALLQHQWTDEITL